MMKNDKIIMGKMASPYGVRGWIKVISYTKPIDNLLRYPHWQIKHQDVWQSIPVEKGKVHGKWLIVKLPGCNDRETAKLYTNDYIALAREALPDAPKNEYYWTDLIGLQVVTLQGALLGQIKALMETGANDVLVIKPEKTQQDILIPYNKHYVKSIDLTKKQMIVDWPI